MPVQQPILDTGTEVSRYRVERLIARGGMGLVYRARDSRLDRPVALKVLSPELSDDERFRERFVRESRLAAAVDHPNVIPVYEADDWNGLLFIAMRFVDGVDLHTVLGSAGRMDPPAAMPLLGQAADALDAAHRVGLVHRDVKPGNFMLAGASAERVPPNTHVYLTDFGLTKRASSVSGLTRTGQFLGSLHYVAPEQIRGEDVDARTDVYALACVAFETLAGRPVFDVEGEAGLLWAHMSLPPPALSGLRPDLPAAVDDVIGRAMAKNLADRPDTCAEFLADLHSALGMVPGWSLPGRADPTHISGSAGASTAPHGGGHPSFPPHATASPADAGQPARQPTTAQPLAGWGPPVAGWAPTSPPAAPPGAGSGAAPAGAWDGGIGGPPPPGPGGPGGPGGPPPGGGGVPAPSWQGGPAPKRSRGRMKLLVALGAVVALLAVGLLIWSPWSGPDLVARDMVVVPYSASVPSDWHATTETTDATFTVFGPKDWSALVKGDSDAIARAETAAKQDPQSLVYLYVDPSDNVYADTAVDAASQLQSALGGRLVEQGTRDVGGKKGLEVGGVIPLGESGAQLRLYAVAVKDDPRMLMIFLCPPSIYEQWRPTFDAIVDSVKYTG